MFTTYIFLAKEKVFSCHLRLKLIHHRKKSEENIDHLFLDCQVTMNLSFSLLYVVGCSLMIPSICLSFY